MTKSNLIARKRKGTSGEIQAAAKRARNQRLVNLQPGREERRENMIRILQESSESESD